MGLGPSILITIFREGSGFLGGELDFFVDIYHTLQIWRVLMRHVEWLKTQIFAVEQQAENMSRIHIYIYLRCV